MPVSTYVINRKLIFIFEVDKIVHCIIVRCNHFIYENGNFQIMLNYNVRSKVLRYFQSIIYL